MDFDLAEQNYIRLEKLRRSGQIGVEEYRTQLGALRVVDEQGRTWMVQEQTGQWYVWDGAQWLAQAPTGRQGIIHMPAASTPAAQMPTAPVQAAPTPAYAPPTQMPTPAAPSYPPQATYTPPQASGAGGYAQPASTGYAPPQAQAGYVQAGYAAQPVVPANIALARKRPGCVAITFRMLLWALVWGGAAWAVNSLLRVTPWWAYLGVGLAALATLVLWVRLMTRHGRALRQLTKGGVA